MLLKCYKCGKRVITNIIGTIWFHGPHSEVSCTGCTSRTEGNFIPRYIEKTK